MKQPSVWLTSYSWRRSTERSVFGLGVDGRLNQIACLYSMLPLIRFTVTFPG